MQIRFVISVLKNKMESYAFENMPVSFIFMQDNGPKHTFKLVKDWSYKEPNRVLNWPAQSSELNHIDNFWTDVKCTIAQKTSTET